MHAFTAELDKQVQDIRQRLAQARAEDNELLVESLIGELEKLVTIADRNDVDTGQMEAVLAAETGSIPQIADPEDS